MPGSPLILDAGALIGLGKGSAKLVALADELQRAGYRLIVPAVVLVEALTGRPTDALLNRIILQAADVPAADEMRCRRAARLRAVVSEASAVDALVVAEAEASPPGLQPIVLSFDPHLSRLAARADREIAVPDLLGS
jgi:hypothetical protein